MIDLGRTDDRGDLSRACSPLDHTRVGESGWVEYNGELNAHMISLQAVATVSDSVGSDSRIGRNIEDI